MTIAKPVRRDNFEIWDADNKLVAVYGHASTMHLDDE